MAILTRPGANTKLGPKVVSWSRPVGSTCPARCPFLTGILPNGQSLPAAHLCYADRLQTAVPTVARAWERNGPGRGDLGRFTSDLSEELSEAAREGYSVRLHVGGDFLREDGRLDWEYVVAVIDAFQRARPRPRGWVYTHAWRELTKAWLPAFGLMGIEVFASVHGTKEAKEARGLGYERLAIDGGYMPDGGGPAWPRRGALACPEQRLGFEKITCSSCGYCLRPGGDVVFYRHWPGAPNYRPGGKHVEL